MWNVPNVALTRRTTLLAGAVLGAAPLLSGCSDDSGTPAARQTAAAERLRAAAAGDSTRLLARYDATLAAHPALGPRLGPLRAEVARHAEAFGARPAGGPEGSAGPSAPGASGRPGAPEESGASPKAGAPQKAAASKKAEDGSGASGSGVPGDEKAARGALADAERRLADARTRTLRTAPPELARLLASVAAAGAAHAYLLTAAG